MTTTMTTTKNDYTIDQWLDSVFSHEIIRDQENEKFEQYRKNSIKIKKQQLDLEEILRAFRRDQHYIFERMLEEHGTLNPWKAYRAKKTHEDNNKFILFVLEEIAKILATNFSESTIVERVGDGLYVKYFSKYYN